MYRREKEFNEKLLAMRDRKMDVVKAVSMLNQEYNQICELLRIDFTPTIDIAVKMNPEEFPERYSKLHAITIAIQLRSIRLLRDTIVYTLPKSTRSSATAEKQRVSCACVSPGWLTDHAIY